jgi:hypothetical protein
MDMSNLTNTASESSDKESKTEYSTKHQYTAISEHSLVTGTPEAIAEWLTLSVAASHASHSATPEPDLEKMTHEICGAQHSKSSMRYDPDSRSWKTFEGFFPSMMVESSGEFSETWQTAGMIADGEFFPQQKWERRISVIDSGLLPTPRAMEVVEHPMKQAARLGDRSGTKPNNLSSMAAFNLWEAQTHHVYPALTGQVKWLTPKASEKPVGEDNAKFTERMQKYGNRSKQSFQSLSSQVRHYPTPDANMGNRGTQAGWKPVRDSGHTATYTLNQSVRDIESHGGTQTQPRKPGQLNPNWVEWLMGWCIGWTDLKPLEMDKYQQWLQQHGGF